MKNYINPIKPKNFQSDVQSLIDFADKKGLFIHGLFLDGNNGNGGVASPDQNPEWQAKLTALFILRLVDANGSDLDNFIDEILAEVAKLRDKND